MQRTPGTDTHEGINLWWVETDGGVGLPIVIRCTC